jgi:signal transduction histidine kinase
MRNFFYLLIGSLLLCACRQKLGENNSEQTRLDSLIVKSQQMDFNPKEVEKHLSEGLELLKTYQNDSTKRVYLNKISNQYFNIGLMDDYLNVCRLNLQLSEQAKDSSMMPIIHIDISDYYYYFSVYDSAYFHVNKVIKILKNKPNHVLLGRAYLNKAAISHSQKALIEAEIEAIEALKIGENIDNKRLVYDASNLLGLILNKLEDYERSLEYHFKALNTLSDLKKDAQYFVLQSSTNNNLGITYKNQERYHDAIKFFEQGLENRNLKNIYPVHYAVLLDNLAHTRLMLGKPVALSDFLVSLRIRDSLGFKSGLIYSRMHIGDYYLDKKDTLSAIAEYQLAMSLANVTKSYEEVLKLLNQLAVLEPLKTKDYLKRQIFLSDSLNTAERNIRNKFTRIEYETALVEEEKKVLQKQNSWILGVSIVVFLFLILFYIIFRQKVKEKELLLVQDQQEANQKVINLMIDQQNKVEEGRMMEKGRISRELHDGVLSELTGIRLKLNVLYFKADLDAIALCIRQIENLKELETNIRNISHDLNQEVFFQNETFIVLIQNLVSEMEHLYQLPICLNNETEVHWELYNNEFKINVFRTIQEALQNCVKYANANSVEISFEEDFDFLIWQIKDDGVGFDTLRKKRGIGLKNMLSRVELMKGNMEVKSEKNKGTTIIFKIPSELKK